MSNLLLISSGIEILITVVVTAAVALLIALAVWRTKVERRRYLGSVMEKGLISFESFKKHVENVLMSANKRTHFFIYEIDIRDYSNLYKSLGETQYKNIQQDIIIALTELAPFGIKVALKKEDVLLMFVKPSPNVDYQTIGELILKNVAKNVVISGSLSVDININVSVVVYPQGTESFESILNNLQLSIILSRKKGLNNMVLFTSQIGNSQTEEFKYYQEIKQAMDDKEFGLYYQAIVDTNSMEVGAGEALIRWNHKTQGVLPPSRFLHIMEQTGDINWVGVWCFEQLVRQSAAWMHTFDHNVIYSINLSERQLQNPDLADELRSVVKKNKANTSYFAVELADLNIFRTSEIAQNNLAKIQQYGFLVAADNFGLATSDVTVFDRLSVNIIKIDGKFWRKAQESIITMNVIETLVSYAKEKNVMLVAQGVETKEEMNTLRKLGINYMQGYLFSKPKDVKEFAGDVAMTPWAAELNTAPGTPPKADVIADETLFVELENENENLDTGAQNDVIEAPDDTNIEKSSELSDDEIPTKKPKKNKKEAK